MALARAALARRGKESHSLSKGGSAEIAVVWLMFINCSLQFFHGWAPLKQILFALGLQRHFAQKDRHFANTTPFPGGPCDTRLD